MGLTTEEQKIVEAFQRDVVQPSMEKLVIVDFWAEWCGPCKQLGPILDKVAAQYADRGVHLVKIDVDENKFIAAQFQVRSIPTVYALFQGKPVADLTPARSEQQLAQALDQLLDQLPVQPGAWGGASEPQAPDFGPMIAEAEAMLDGGDAGSAHDMFANVLLNDPENGEAVGGMARALLAMERKDEAAALLDGVSEELSSDPAIERARSAIALAAERRDPSEVEALRAKVEAAPGDHAARFDLSSALIGNGDHDAGATELLKIIEADREWEEGKARTRLLQLFETVGLEDPWVATTRRKLSAILFG